MSVVWGLFTAQASYIGGIMSQNQSQATVTISTGIRALRNQISVKQYWACVGGRGDLTDHDACANKCIMPLDTDKTLGPKGGTKDSGNLNKCKQDHEAHQHNVIANMHLNHQRLNVDQAYLPYSQRIRHDH